MSFETKVPSCLVTERQFAPSSKVAKFLFPYMVKIVMMIDRVINGIPMDSKSDIKRFWHSFDSSWKLEFVRILILVKGDVTFKKIWSHPWKMDYSGNKLAEFHSWGEKIGQHIDLTCRTEYAHKSRDKNRY